MRQSGPRGVEMRLVIEGDRTPAARADSALLKAVDEIGFPRRYRPTVDCESCSRSYGRGDLPADGDRLAAAAQHPEGADQKPGGVVRPLPF
jgi:hypothetical protein